MNADRYHSLHNYEGRLIACASGRILCGNVYALGPFDRGNFDPDGSIWEDFESVDI